MSNGIRKYFTSTAMLAFGVFIALVSAVLIAKAPFFFRDSVLPFTDYASNDILVTWAKHFELWHGNYSRVGFYHPGPFYFQLMAWSEIAFHDVLPVFHTTFAAQIFASLCLCAFALALVVALLHKTTGRVSMALIGASTYAIVLLGAEAFSFTAPWPPFLYVAAATIMVVGMCGVLLRGWRWLPWLILGGAALVHGHASFIGLVPIILFVATAGAWVMWRKHWLAPLAERFPQRSTWVLCTALVVVFLAPMIMQTVAHWPGEFPKYFAFAGHREPNALMAVARYVASFMPAWGLVLPAAAGAAWLLRDSANGRAVLSSGLIFIAGLAAAAFYARKGVDGLEYRYLEYWFVPFYALLAAMTVIGLVDWLQRSHPAANKFIALLAVAGAVVMGGRSPELLQTPSSEAESSYREAYKVVSRFAKPGRPAVVAIDREGGWDVSWSDSITMLAYANRVGGGNAPVCIEFASWHILFHEKYRCPDDGRAPDVFISGRYHPERTQIAATNVARYYAGKIDPRQLSDGTTVVAADGTLASDTKLGRMDAAATLRLEGAPSVDAQSGMVQLRVLVGNQANAPLAGRGAYPVNLAVVQLPGGKGGLQATPRTEVARLPLPGIAPGATVEMPVSVPVSTFNAGAVLRMELVQEGVGWFSYDFGLPPLDIGPLQPCPGKAPALCEAVPAQ